MSRITHLLTLLSLLLMFSIIASPVEASHVSYEFSKLDWPGGLIIDHTCIDLESIPLESIETAQDNMRIHYAHTSHGGQITTGLNRIETANESFSQAQGSGTLPTESGALCILDGNPPHSYITPDLYWETTEGIGITQTTLNNNPTIAVSLWSWCTQLNSYSEEPTQEYLDTMTALENANPGITFVYMTCNAQSDGGSGYNRWLRNEQIREYCTENNKVLFDFADLDSWSNGVQNTYEYEDGGETYNIPLEHEDFNGNEAGHTTYSSCEQKGRAFWWLVATLAGWNSGSTTITTTTTGGTPTTTTSTTPTGQTPLNMEALATAGVIIIVLVIAAVGFSRYR